MKMEQGLFRSYCSSAQSQGRQRGRVCRDLPEIRARSAPRSRRAARSSGVWRRPARTAARPADSGMFEGDSRRAVPTGNVGDQGRRARLWTPLTVKDVLVGDVWIVAGQSNAQGCGYVKDGPRARPVREGVLHGRPARRPAQDPIHNMWKTVDQVHIDLLRRREAAEEHDHRRRAGGARSASACTSDRRCRRACWPAPTAARPWPNGTRAEETGQQEPVRRHDAPVSEERRQDCRRGVVQGDERRGPERGAPLHEPDEEAGGAPCAATSETRPMPFVLVQISRVVARGDAATWNSIQEQERLLPEVIRRCATVPAIDLSLEDAIHISGKGQITLGPAPGRRHAGADAGRAGAASRRSR